MNDKRAPKDGSIGHDSAFTQIKANEFGRSSSLVDKSTRRIFYFLICLIAGFVFDRQVAELMYLIGYDRNAVSHIWFIRDIHAFLSQENYLNGVGLAPFHLFELFVWLAILINLVRLALGVIFIGSVEEAQFALAKQRTTVFRFFWAWLVSGPGGIVASIFLAKPLAETLLFQRLLIQSPKAFIGLEAFVFCGACFLFVDGIIMFLDLRFGEARGQAP